MHSSAEWPWSSYRANAGLCAAPFWLTTDRLLSAISSQRSEAVARYAAFVAVLQRNIAADGRLREMPAVNRRPLPIPLAQIADEHERDEAILCAYDSGGYSLKEIGDYCITLLPRQPNREKATAGKRQDVTRVAAVSPTAIAKALWI